MHYGEVWHIKKNYIVRNNRFFDRTFVISCSQYRGLPAAINLATSSPNLVWHV